MVKVKSTKIKSRTTKTEPVAETQKNSSTTTSIVFSQIKNPLGKLFGGGLKPTKTLYLALLVAGLLLLFAFKKSWFVAATINSNPVSNFELLSRLNNLYRQKVLDQIIVEKIVLEEAKKKNITVKNDEIINRITQLEKNVGGAESLDTLLAQGGLDRKELKNQVKIQLIAEKLYQNESSVSAEEVKQFVDQNKERLVATTAAEQTIEAEEILKQQKVSQIFSQKLPELKQKANIKIF